MKSEPTSWSATILGEPASKSNSRQLVWRGKRPAFIKSRKAQKYVRDAALQILPPPRPFDQPVRMDCKIYYRTERPDLDDALICDVLQAAGVVTNDRLIREKHIAHGIDRDNPRAEIRIEPRWKLISAIGGRADVAQERLDFRFVP